MYEGNCEAPRDVTEAIVMCRNPERSDGPASSNDEQLATNQYLCDSGLHAPMLNSLASRINLSKHRLEALADGVFAIAATLLVLEIKIPELPRDASMAMLRHALRGEVPVIFSFF